MIRIPVHVWLVAFCAQALAQTPSVQLSVVGTYCPPANYQAGNSFSVTVTGAPLQPVTVLHNGAGPFAMGTTNSNGVWSTSGSWSPGDVGEYTQIWYVGGQQASPTLVFWVIMPPPAPEVELKVKHAGSGPYYPGETYELIVSGGPYLPVRVSKNGGPITEVGYTNSSGKWTMYGQWNASHIGSHQEQWYVDCVPANILHYSIVNPPPPPCPKLWGDYYWIWSPVEVVNQSSTPSSVVAAAMGGWNSLPPQITLQASTQWHDLAIEDGSLDDGVLGEIDMLTQWHAGCAGYTDSCGGCMMSHMFFAGTIKLDQTQIAEARFWFNQTHSVAWVQEMTLSHEFGHALGLDHLDADPQPLRCPLVKSIMNGWSQALLTCHVKSPVSPCDSNALSARYPVPPQPFCAPGVCYLDQPCLFQSPGAAIQPGKEKPCYE